MATPSGIATCKPPHLVGIGTHLKDVVDKCVERSEGIHRAEERDVAELETQVEVVVKHAVHLQRGARNPSPFVLSTQLAPNVSYSS